MADLIYLKQLGVIAGALEDSFQGLVARTPSIVPLGDYAIKGSLEADRYMLSGIQINTSRLMVHAGTEIGVAANTLQGAGLENAIDTFVGQHAAMVSLLAQADSLYAKLPFDEHTYLAVAQLQGAQDSGTEGCVLVGNAQALRIASMLDGRYNLGAGARHVVEESVSDPVLALRIWVNDPGQVDPAALNLLVRDFRAARYEISVSDIARSGRQDKR